MCADSNAKRWYEIHPHIVRLARYMVEYEGTDPYDLLDMLENPLDWQDELRRALAYYQAIESPKVDRRGCKWDRSSRPDN